MKLKRYLQFIKESLKEDLDSGKMWELDENQIREYLIELDDAGYLITVGFGFVKREKINRYPRPSIEKEVYTENIVSGEEIRPAYNIVIEKSSDLSKEDVTDSLKFACSIIEGEGDCNVELIAGDGGVLDIDTVLVQGGFFTDVDPEDENSGIELEGWNASLSIFAKQKNTIKIKPTDLEEYYGWDVSVRKDGQLWAEMDLEDLADFILSPRSEYKDSLVKGQEHMWDYYDISDYYPDIISLFNYSVEKENQVLVVKAIIKELGGYEQAINHIGDECDNQIYELVKDMSEEELINYLLKESFYETIKQLASHSEVLQEIRDTIANFEMSAHCDDNYDEIVSNFDGIVSDELGQFEKVEKEVTKYYTTKDAEGNQVRREYKTDVTYYQFSYNNDWISDVDSEYLYNKELDDLFRDFVRESDIDRNLNPRISDYGDVNKEEMNKDIKAYLTRYLSK
jgi:hypothetical protein